MALTFDIDVRLNPGFKRLHMGTVTFDSSYAGSGGEAFVAADLGLARVEVFQVFSVRGLEFRTDLTGLKIAVGLGLPDLFITGGQAAGSALQILPDSDAGIVGKTVATNRTLDATEAGYRPAERTDSFKEIAATTDLSAIVAFWIAVGV